MGSAHDEGVMHAEPIQDRRTGDSIQLEVTGYHLRLGGNRAVLELDGGAGSGPGDHRPMARIDFRPGATPVSFINGGGFISIVRPMELLAATVDMLRHDAPVFIDANGTLTTSQRIADRVPVF